MEGCAKGVVGVKRGLLGVIWRSGVTGPGHAWLNACNMPDRPYEAGDNDPPSPDYQRPFHQARVTYSSFQVHGV